MAALESWYADGLRFQCSQCGRCCHSHGEYAYVYLTTPEIEALATHLDLPRAAFLQRYCQEDEGWTVLRLDRPRCPFLGEGNQCTVYEARPVQCRTWPFWKDNLADREHWEQTVRAVCPGIGAGPRYPAAVVRELSEGTETWYESDGACPPPPSAGTP